MKIRLTEGTIRFRVTRDEITALLSGNTLSVSAAGIDVYLAPAASSGIEVNDGTVVIRVLRDASRKGSREQPLVCSGEVDGTTIIVELDLDMI